jgi:hypothetical protein
MLPMRRGLSLAVVGSLLVVVALSGCKNQAAGTFTNPFLTPDRVPPPSTRVLAPGTAQPYYPGDPIPGVAPTVGTPVIGAPVATPGYAPAPGYTTAPTYAPAPTTGNYPATSPPLTTPPGGWGSTYAPQSSFQPAGPLNGDAVSVPADQQGLRFAGADSAATVAAPSLPSAPSLNAVANIPASARLPIQSILPLGEADDVPGPRPSQLAQREVTTAEYFAAGATTGAQLASAEISRDGFRPQGSVPRPLPVKTDDAFRPPSGRNGAVTGGEDASRFAVGENFESLRGQLEYWPVSGEWSLRYAAEGAPADSLGGRVMIDNPQVLANLQPGEMVTVRGQAFSKSTDTGVVQPAYRVSAVQRQRL